MGGGCLRVVVTHGGSTVCTPELQGGELNELNATFAVPKRDSNP